jgi:hypothetical protein
MTAAVGFPADGPAAVSADPDVLRDLVDDATSVRQALAGVHDHLDTLHRAAVAACGDLAPPGGAVDDLAALLDLLAATETVVGETAAAVAAADRPMAACAPPTVPAAGTTIPWLDLEGDSGGWVVDLLRAGVPGADRSIRRRLLDSGADAVATMASAAWELSPFNQAHVLATDPGLAARNWWRAARSGGQTLIGSGRSTLLLAAAANPVTDLLYWHRTGQPATAEIRSAGAELARGLLHQPDQVVASLVRWDQLEDDPYAWFGGVATELLLELAGPRMVTPARLPSPLRPPRPGTSAPIPLRHPTPELAAGAPPGLPPGHRRPVLEVQRRREPEWAPAPGVVSHRSGPFEPPDEWVAAINGDGIDQPGRRGNCIDCTRAVEANWRGDDAVAAPLRSPAARGTTLDRLESWSGGRLVPTSLEAIERRLTELGHGSSALVASTWDSGGAHAYNAVNRGGIVTWIDGQLGEVGPWPPRYARNVDHTLAIFLGPDGRPR